MRLIDADALKQKIRQEMKTLGFSDPKEQVKRLTFQKTLLFMKEQPTIAQPTWISCAEKLPEPNEWVLCKCRAGIYEVMKMANDKSWVHDIRHCYMSEFVTHWMPLPQPPKGEEEAII